MKTALRSLLLLFGMSISLQVISAPKNYKANFIIGKAEVQSMNSLAFGPEGILFIGDSKSALVFAIDTKDISINEAAEVKLEKIDQHIADLLGSNVEEVHIQDLAVNPISKNIYVAVHHADGTPVLLRIEGDKITSVSLDHVGFSQASINNAVGEDAKDHRGRSLRTWSISDLVYSDDQVMVSGLSNQEFSSTFRSMPFPFTDDQKQSSLEIYHAAHGKYETYAPIKTFTTATFNGQPHLVASFTCTPLVVFPLESLKPSTHVKGRTVAELGNWNTPLDIMEMDKEGEKFLLIANSNRALMKINYKDIEKFEGSLTEPVPRSDTEGVNFIALPFVNVQQLDKVNDDTFVMIQRKSNGNLDLFTVGVRSL